MVEESHSFKPILNQQRVVFRPALHKHTMCVCIYGVDWVITFLDNVRKIPTSPVSVILWPPESQKWANWTLNWIMSDDAHNQYTQYVWVNWVILFPDNGGKPPTAHSLLVFFQQSAMRQCRLKLDKFWIVTHQASREFDDAFSGWQSEVIKINHFQ